MMTDVLNKNEKIKVLVEALIFAVRDPDVSDMTVDFFVAKLRKELKEEPEKGSNFHGWKVGAYEPTTGIHGDIAYKYTIDLVAKTITTEEV